MSNKGITPRGNIKVQFPKRRTKTVRVYPGPKTATPQDRRHQNRTPILDTIQTIVPAYENKGVHDQSSEYEKWLKRRDKKAITSVLSIQLRKYAQDQLWSCPKSKRWYWMEWSSRYARSMFCCHSVQQDGNKLKAMFCEQRWCSVCARNKAMKLYHAYKDQLKNLEDVWFVTLTIANMDGDQLKLAIAKMKSVWTAIYKKMHRTGNKPMGAKSLEVKGGVKGYHPHYHILISGKENAMMVQKEWLKHFKKDAEKVGKFYAEQAGQYVAPCRKDDDGSITKSILEVFKYSIQGIEKGEIVKAEYIHTINTSTFRGQMFGAFGLKKPIEDTKRTQSEISEAGWLKPGKVCYNWDGSEKTWMDRYDRDMLSL
jgi:hypothetical protein